MFSLVRLVSLFVSRIRENTQQIFTKFREKVAHVSRKKPLLVLVVICTTLREGWDREGYGCG